MTTARRRDLLMILAGLFVIVLDQLTKSWVVQYFVLPNGYKPAIPLLGQIVELTYVRNSGVAFSLLSSDSVKFLFIAIAIGVIGYLYWRNRENGSLLLKFSFGLVVGGALGNLIDRFRLGYVVDFIHFYIPNRFDFAVFNVADSAISVGVVLLAFLLWQGSTAETQRTGVAPTEIATEPTTASQSSIPRVRRRVTGE